MLKLKEIAMMLNGRVIGDPDVGIEGVRGIEEAGRGDLTFVANRKYRSKLETTGASAILVAPGTEAPGKNLIWVEDPYVAFGLALDIFYPEETPAAGVDPRASVAADAVVSPEATLYPGVYVGRRARVDRGAVLHPGCFVGAEAVIGEDSVLHPGVTVYRRCLVGRRVTLHAGVVVGGDGFGFARPGWENRKIPQVGIVQIDDDVEIGANTTIDRATLGRTWIQRGVKIDNLVQIAHNVVVGENAVIVSQAGISGSTVIGKGVILGGQVGVIGHIRIGDHVMAAARTGIHKDVPPNQIVSGAPHRPHREWLRQEACVANLPEMRKSLQALQHRVIDLERRLAAAGKDDPHTPPPDGGTAAAGRAKTTRKA